MISQILRSTLRSLRRDRLISIIHILGLSIGLAVCAVITIFIVEENSFDKYHQNYSEIHRVIGVNSDGVSGVQQVPYAVATYGPALKERFPEVKEQARIFAMFDWTVSKLDGKPQVSEAMLSADKEFFDIFTIPFVAGDKETAMSSPDKVVISEKIADQFFHGQDAIGKTLLFDGKHQFVVGGVIENFPENSHISFEYLLPIEVFLEDPEWAWLNYWYTSTVTYVQLEPGVNIADLDGRLADLMHELMPDMEGLTGTLQPLADIHLRSAHIMWDYAFHASDEKYILLFGGIGLGVLLLACFNFMNLATSRSLKRAKEIGMRKVVGASKSQLFRLFIGEAILLALIAVPVALLLLELVLPYIRQVADRQLVDIFLGFNPWMLAFVLFTIVTGFLAGGYPALVLSSLKPIKNLRGKVDTTLKGKNIRRVLVTTQFLISILLVLFTGTVLLQLDYLKGKALGFNRDNVVALKIADESDQTDYLPLRNEIHNAPGVKSASLSQVVPSLSTAEDHIIPTGKEGENPTTIHMNIVCDQFIQTTGLKIVEGREFDPARPADMLSIIINETAKESFGWDTIEGKTVKGGSGRIFPVTGVVEDYNFQSLHRPVEPQMLVYAPQRGEYLMMNLEAGDVSQTLARIEEIVFKHAPHRSFDYFFIDESIEYWYQNEERLGKLLTTFCALALLISCMGVLGLIIHATERRRSEIGIRKVLGATTGSIMNIIIKEFVALIIVANVICWPIAFWIGGKWGANFAYTAPTQWWLFPAAALFTLILVLSISGFSTWRAANLNPIETIRDE
jgi:putative ABC transport system permease protein